MKGNLICISANVEETMQKILPIEQNLIPVSFKRKLEYEGHFIHEIIDKRKVEIWHEYMKENNPHYRDTQFDSDLIEEFCYKIRKSLESLEKDLVQATQPDDEILKEPVDEVPLFKQYDTLMCDKYENDIESNTVANRLADLIVEHEIRCKIPVDEILDEDEMDELYNSESDSEDEGENEYEVPHKKSKEEPVSVAPGEGGEFKTWGSEKDLYLEELAFPGNYVV